VIAGAAFWLVLAGSVAAFWMLPRSCRVPFLGLVSFGYLATIDPRSVAALLVWSLVFYYTAPRSAGRTRAAGWLGVGLVFSIIGYLAYFKYVPPLLQAFATNPVSEQLLIPLGISYFTFKLVHYAIEMGRGNIPEHPLSTFLLYIFLFPIYTAGPIERFDNFLRNRDEHWSRDAAADGLTRIVYGLIKKFAIAEALILPLLARSPTAELIGNLDEQSVARVWIHAALFFAYSYLDFSAYSDVAIGASRLFGFRIIENFNFPFLARNINDFWQRWHMSLSGWCRTYVYMPTIGLTRNPYLAIYATMGAIGMWHEGSLTWLGWGLYHATGIVSYGAWMRYRRRRRWMPRDTLPRRALGIALTMLFVSGSYVFPAAAGHGGIVSAARLLAKLVAIDLPAP